MIPRTASATLARMAAGFPVIVVTGPRQSGKTTLAQASFPDKPYVSLENLNERAFAQEDPQGFLGRYPVGAIIDEVQHVPALFSFIQTRVDASRRMGEFILTGSQNFGLMASVAQSLAGRAGIVQLLPFSLGELAAAGRLPATLDDLLYCGLYPPLHDRPLDPAQWFGSYILAYLERDLRQLANVHDLGLFQRFIALCAARTGQLLNLSSLALDCGIGQTTARNWLDLLQASYVIFLLRPHHRNFGKRLVKSPKLYFCDTGLAAALMNIQGVTHMAIHPTRPALFENLIVIEYLKRRYNAGLASNLFFWRDNIGHEVDLLLDEGETLRPIEVKSGQTIGSEHFDGLRTWQRYAGAAAGPPALVYAGDDGYTRSGIQVVPWNASFPATP
ncbi:MAG: ATP-binding protein [Rhodocyclaceae bacterium]|nr:ATP-binding protein [Rhodocyclaceae bacterium]